MDSIKMENSPNCPKCNAPLTKIVEEYIGIGTFSLVGEEYEVTGTEEKHKIMCAACRATLPVSIASLIEKKLPKV